MTAPDEGLSERLVRWMAANRAELDARMSEEASHALHEEFMLAEGGTLPDRATRIGRARQASARAWMRHLGRALEAEWDGAEPDLAARLERWRAEHRERREALALEEAAIAERRGASGDPVADERDGDLAAHCRHFAEGLASIAGAIVESGESPPQFARRVGVWSRSREAHRREVEREARTAWSSAPAAGAGGRVSAADAAPEPDEMRVREAAAVWAHVQVLTEALEHALTTRPEAPA